MNLAHVEYPLDRQDGFTNAVLSIDFLYGEKAPEKFHCCLCNAEKTRPPDLVPVNAVYFAADGVEKRLIGYFCAEHAKTKEAGAQICLARYRDRLHSDGRQMMLFSHRIHRFVCDGYPDLITKPE